MQKKGISTIIATIMMVLFVLIASSVVWVVIQNLLAEQEEDISSGLSKVYLTVGDNSVQVGDSNVSMIINREVGEGTLTKIKIIIYNSGGESYAEDVTAETLTELGSKRFTISKGDLTDIAKISVAPITKSSSGKESIQRVTDTYILP